LKKRNIAGVVSNDFGSGLDEMKDKRKATTRRATTATELAARHTRARRGLPRAQQEAPAQRRLFKGGKSAPRSKKSSVTSVVFSALFILGLVLIALLVLKSAVGGRFFAVRHIELEGQAHAPREMLLSEIQQHAANGLWQTDLEAVRKALKSHTWVREAEVARVFPDRLRVKIEEREPFALVRRANNTLVWIDRDGAVLGERAQFAGEQAPPLIKGLAEGQSAEVMEINRRHLQLYQNLLTDLDREEPKLSPRIAEVFFDEAQGVKLGLSDQKVTVLVGTQDFRARLNAALKVLAAVERRDVAALKLFRISDAERLFRGEPIAYLNATLPDRVIVGLAE
jgi:cell division septal protein FtsQ